MESEAVKHTAGPFWTLIKDGEEPKGEVLLLTASRIVVIGDWYDGVWRVGGRIKWVGDKLTSDFHKDDITHWAPMVSTSLDHPSIADLLREVTELKQRYEKAEAKIGELMNECQELKELLDRASDPHP